MTLALRHSINHEKGKFFELLARIYMGLFGFKVIESRFRRRGGECDIISTKNNILCFTEVKYRKSRDDAICAWSLTQRRRMIYVSQLHQSVGKELKFYFIFFCSRGMGVIETDWRDFERA